MRQGTKRLLSMALALVFIVGSFAIYFQGIQPAYEILQKKRGELEGRRQFAEEQRQAVNRVLQLISDFGGTNEATIKSLSASALPIGLDLSSALAQLLGLANLSGLSVQSVKPTVEASPLVLNKGGVVKPLGVIRHDLQMRGGYLQLKDFMQKLENNIMVFEIQKLEVKPERSSDGTLAISVTLTSYFQR